MPDFENDFEWVVSSVRETVLLESTVATLEWDERTGLPSEAGEHRAKQVTLLSGLIHSRRTTAELGDRLLRLSTSSLAADSHTDRGATIRCLLKDFQRHSKLPVSLVKSISEATVLGQQTWAIARPKNDFATFLPHLERIVALRKEEAQLLKVDAQAPYDALLDQYEEGATVAMIAPVLNELRDQLVPLVQRCTQSKHAPDGSSLARSYPIETQRRMSRWVAEKIGYQFSRGRLDETDHPFCTSLGPSDHRILTRYAENHFSSGFYGTLHEAGHAMYEQGLPQAWFGLPPGSAVSLGIHESQSRLWENMIGRSRAFCEWCFPELQKEFPSQLKEVSVDQFFRDLNRVQPSLIRVDADEATYNLHILIRFELEQALLDGNLKPKDLPEAWRSKYQSYLGVVPPDDRDGVLQDVHWSAGLIGYFPTYTLGNIYAAQLMVAARKQISDLDLLITQGDFAPLLDWLRWNVHRYGRRLSPRDLVQQATAEPFSARPLVDYLTSKLEGVYNM